MTRISICCTLFLLGCPVEPQDVQAPEQGGQGTAPSPVNPEGLSNNNANNALNNGRPPGIPPEQAGQPAQNNGGEAPTANVDGTNGDNMLPPLEGGAPLPEAATEPLANGVNAIPNQAEGAGGMQAEGAGGVQAEGAGGMQAPNAGPQDGTGTPPETPAGAMPAFNTPPSFGTLIGDGETITITLQVTGADSYNMEFLIAQEVDGRLSPRVIHMEKSVTANTSVRAPANYDYPVWLIITADLNGDGPSDDDLIGGTTEPMTFAAEDMTLDVALQADDDWMSQVPWYTKGLEDGPPVTP